MYISMNLRLEAKLYELQEELEEEGKTKEEIEKELDKLRTRLQSSMVRDNNECCDLFDCCSPFVRWGVERLIRVVLIQLKDKK